MPTYHQNGLYPPKVSWVIKNLSPLYNDKLLTSIVQHVCCQYQSRAVFWLHHKLMRAKHTQAFEIQLVTSLSAAKKFSVQVARGKDWYKGHHVSSSLTPTVVIVKWHTNSTQTHQTHSEAQLGPSTSSHPVEHCFWSTTWDLSTVLNPSKNTFSRWKPETLKALQQEAVQLSDLPSLLAEAVYQRKKNVKPE